MADRRDDLVELTTAPNEYAAGVLRIVLTADGIPSWLEPASGPFLQIMGASGIIPVRVLVRRAEIDRARETIEREREGSIDLDWSEIDVGEPADRIATRIAQRGEGDPHVPHGSGLTGRVFRWCLLSVAALVLAACTTAAIVGAIGSANTFAQIAVVGAVLLVVLAVIAPVAALGSGGASARSTRCESGGRDA